MGCLLRWLPAVLTMGGLLPLLHGRVGRPALRHRPIHIGKKPPRSPCPLTVSLRATSVWFWNTPRASDPPTAPWALLWEEELFLK